MKGSRTPILIVPLKAGAVVVTVFVNVFVNVLTRVPGLVARK